MGGVTVFLWTRRTKSKLAPAEARPGSSENTEQPDGPVSTDIRHVQDELKALRQAIERREQELHVLRPTPDRSRFEEDRHGEFVTPFPATSSTQETMLKIAHDFWDGTLQRSTLRMLMARHTSLSFRRVGKLEGRANSTATYPFEATESPEWLWAELGGGEALALPLDAERFDAGPLLELLQRLFEGLERMPAGTPRFVRAERACRLRQDASSPGRYSRVEKGRLVLEGGSLPPARAPLAESKTLAAEPSRQELQSLSRAIAAELGDRWQTDLRRVVEETARRSKPSESFTEANLREVLRQELTAWAARVVPTATPATVATPLTDAGRRETTSASDRPGNKARSLTTDRQEVAPPARSPRTPQPEVVVAGDADGLRARFAAWSQAVEPFSIELARESAPDGEAYLRRLRRIRERFRKVVPVAWQIELVHLQTTAGPEGPALTSHSLPTDDSEPPLRCTCSAQLHGTLLFQLALRIAEEGSELALFSLPPGPFALSNFPGGYRLLVSGEPGSGPLTLVRVHAPAVVRCSRNGGCEILSRLSGEFSR